MGGAGNRLSGKRGRKKKSGLARQRQKVSNKINRAIRLQYGVLPYDSPETNSLEVLLVTTRQTRQPTDILKKVARAKQVLKSQH